MAKSAQEQTIETYTSLRQSRLIPLLDGLATTVVLGDGTTSLLTAVAATSITGTANQITVSAPAGAVTLSLATGVGARSLFDHYVDGTAGGAEADIYTATLAAGQLSANGQKIVANYGGNFVTLGTELTQLLVQFAGTTIWDSTGIAPASGTTSWRVFVEIIRVSATVIRYTVSLNTTGASGYVYAVSGELTGLTLSGTNVLRIRGASSGVGSGSGDIVGKMGTIEWRPAA